MTETRRAFIADGCLGAAAVMLSPAALLGAAARAFEPAIGVCRSVNDADAARAGGAAYLEVSCREWLVPQQPDAEFERRLEQLRASPVPVRAANSFLPGSLKSVGPEAQHDRVIVYATNAFRRARQTGIGIVTFGSGGSRAIPGGFPKKAAEKQFTALLERMAPIAEQHDVIVCVEPLQSRETNFINRVSEAQKIVETVDHPHVAITADIFHMLREDETGEALRAAGPLIRHIHIAEERGRTPPGHDGDDFTPYLLALRDIDYEGLISIECRWDDLPAQLPKAVRTLRSQIDRLPEAED